MHEPGSTQRAPFRLVRIRTDDWPARERAAMFREVHGRDRISVEPAFGAQLRIDATIIRVPDLALLWGHRSPLRSEFLDGSDRLVLNLYYHEELTLKEISRVIEVSESRVSQIHTESVLQLRAKLADVGR